jgi:FkbM family methyltransferase
MSFYVKLAETLQYIFPKLYKNRFFKKLKNLSKENILERNVEPELFWIQNYLKENDVFVDIGANVGAYLFQVEGKLKTENIFAFEPNKSLYHRLKRIFPDFQIFPMALSNVNKMAEFKIPVINGKQMSSRGTLQLSQKEIGEDKHIIKTVKTLKLDDWADSEQINHINFIKIDVEGNEKETVFGAKKIIEKCKPTMMIEIEQRHHQKPIWDFISEIETWGYKATYLDRKSFSLKELTEELMKIQDKKNVKNYQNYINNIIFIPKK